MRKHLPFIAIVLCFIAFVSARPSAQDAVRNGEITQIVLKTKSLTVKTARGETSVVTTAATVIKDGEKAIAFADLKVGDTVKVTGVRNESGVEAKEIARQPR